MEGQKVVKVFCHEEKSVEQFRRLNQELRESADKANTFSNIRTFSLFNDRVLHVLLAGKDGTALEGGEGFPNFLQLPAIFQQGETSA